MLVTQATPEEIKEQKRKCWHSHCKKTALVEDRGGWRWCVKHYFWQRDEGYFSKARKIIIKNLFK